MLGLPFTEHRAAWGVPCVHGDVHRRVSATHGVYWLCQGFARNQLIVDDADVVLALVTFDRRGGTEDTLKKAKVKGIRVFTVLPNGVVGRA